MDSELSCSNSSSNDFAFDDFSNCSSVESGFCSGLIFTITSRKHSTSLMDNPRVQILPSNGLLDIHSLPDQIARIESLILTQRAFALFAADLMSMVDKRNPAFVMANSVPFVCQFASGICVFTQSPIVLNISFVNIHSVDSGWKNAVYNA